MQGFIDGNQQLGLHPKQIGIAGAQLCLVQSSKEPALLSPQVLGLELPELSEVRPSPANRTVGTKVLP